VILDRAHVLLGSTVLLVAVTGAYGYHMRAVDVAEAKAKVAAQETVINAAEKRAADREQQFKEQLAQILSMKSTPATTPTQIVERIPQYYPQLQPTLQQPTNPQTGQPDTTKPPNLVFDAPQAKLLNDQLVECKVCSLQLTKAQADLADQKSVIAAREKEVAEWKTAAKGGSIWKRTWKAAEYLIVGGAIGYVAAKH